jgi:hypothetical protein
MLTNISLITMTEVSSLSHRIPLPENLPNEFRRKLVDALPNKFDAAAAKYFFRLRRGDHVEPQCA